MHACLLEPEFPMWLLAVERFGLGATIIVFFLAVLWKLVPGVSRLLNAWKKQSDKVTETISTAVPSVLDGLKDLVYHAERVADHVTAQGRDEERHPQADAGGSPIRLHRGRPPSRAAESESDLSTGAEP
jgi:hypothetical protein